MKIKTAVGAAILVSAFHTARADATDNVAVSQAQQNQVFASEFGETRPPVGYVKFCAENPVECGGYSVTEKIKSAQLAMSVERWNLLYQVNTYVNGKIKPVSDQELYGEAERWAYPINAGDCEDYLLLKKRELEKLDFAAKSLRITVVLDENSQGHAVLTVTTDEGDFVLDNRRNEILLWNDTNYTYLKRQSAKDPRRWVALLKQPSPTTAAVSSGSPH